MGDFHNADCSELGFTPGLARKLLICTTTRDDTGKNLQVFFFGGVGVAFVGLNLGLVFPV
jgi:hypothetical protein